MEGSRPPGAAGLRLDWPEVPPRVRVAVEEWLGSPVVSATSQEAGFSPGVAARLLTADGRRFFAKAAGPKPNRLTPLAHRREAAVTAALPEEAPVPRLLWSHDEGEAGWVFLVFEDVEGRNPAVPWRADELDQTLDAIASLSELLTPSPLPREAVARAAGWEVVAGQHWRRVRETSERAASTHGPPAISTGSSPWRSKPLRQWRGIPCST